MDAEQAAKRCREIADLLWDWRKELREHSTAVPPSMSATLLLSDSTDLHVIAALLEGLEGK
jgi:hypothetical protein